MQSRKTAPSGIAERPRSGCCTLSGCGRGIGVMIPLPQDFSEFLLLLNDQQVRYLLIGGYAVAYHEEM
jgi:hypothetical protein